jgi:hypothetical protein
MQRRLFAAAEAKAAGYGGIAAVSRVTRIVAAATAAAPAPPQRSLPCRELVSWANPAAYFVASLLFAAEIAAEMQGR